MIFWIASAIAVALTLWVAADFLFGVETRFPVINVPGLILAAAIWGIGLLCWFTLPKRSS
jgi:hypothetical protein